MTWKDPIHLRLACGDDLLATRIIIPCKEHMRTWKAGAGGATDFGLAGCVQNRQNSGGGSRNPNKIFTESFARVRTNSNHDCEQGHDRWKVERESDFGWEQECRDRNLWEGQGQEHVSFDERKYNFDEEDERMSSRTSSLAQPDPAEAASGMAAASADFRVEAVSFQDLMKYFQGWFETSKRQVLGSFLVPPQGGWVIEFEQRF
eukprot:758684-Hanusia_phi.AAC.5